MIKVCPNKLMQYANRECNAIMTIAICTNTAASSNDSNHHSSTPAAWFASGTAYHGRRYQNLGSWTSWRSYTIVGQMTWHQRRIKKVESYLPAGNVFGGIWRSFSGAAYWMVCNSCLGVASPLAKPASTQSQYTTSHFRVLVLISVSFRSTST